MNVSIIRDPNIVATQLNFRRFAVKAHVSSRARKVGKQHYVKWFSPQFMGALSISQKFLVIVNIYVAVMAKISRAG